MISRPSWRDRLNERAWQLAVRRQAASPDAGDRRMSRGEGGALLAYGMALLVSHDGLAHLGSPILRVLAALLPLPPIVLLVALAVRRVLGMDELQQRTELVALAVAAAGTWLGLGTCWLLDHAGLPLPSLQLGFVGMPVLYLLARRWALRRYA